MAAAAPISWERLLTDEVTGESREYVDGVLVERAMPTGVHSLVQRHLMIGLDGRLQGKGECGPELHVLLAPGTYRICDIAVYLGKMPDGVADVPPLIDIEVLSQDESLSRIIDRFQSLRKWGVRHLWLADPAHRLLFSYSEKGLHQVDTWYSAEFDLTMTAADVFPA